MILLKGLYAVAVVVTATVTASVSTPGVAIGDPGNCGAHDSAIECADDSSTPTTSEYAFMNRLRGNVPGSSTQLLKVARGTCFLVRQGEVTTNGMVNDIAEYLGTSEASAGQVLAVAMDTACTGYTVAANGTTTPRGSSGSGGGGGSAPPVQTGGADGAFLRELSAQGVVVGRDIGADRAISVGKQMCAKLAAGIPDVDLVTSMISANDDIAQGTVTQTMRAGWVVYCPQLTVTDPWSPPAASRGGY